MGNDNKLKVLILGANGMLGHKLYQVLSQDERLDVYGTVRCDYKDIRKYHIFKPNKIIDKVSVPFCDLLDSEYDIRLHSKKSLVVINSIGVIDKYADKKAMAEVNTIFPLQLQALCKDINIRLIHISTDCVFSGREGNYTEGWLADATDAYGKTKWLGEVTGDNTLTIRTSIIGRELVRSRGLLEWFISKKGGTVNGYNNAIFSGFPTVIFAGIIKDIILNHPDLSGLYHVASKPIDKYTLLNMINFALDLGIIVLKTPAFKCDRSLDGSKFNLATGFKPSYWDYMVQEMAEDAKQYKAWR